MKLSAPKEIFPVLDNDLYSNFYLSRKQCKSLLFFHDHM